jgi:hypothetical protein
MSNLPGAATLVLHYNDFCFTHLVRDAGCQRGACWGCLSETGVVGRVGPRHCRDSFIAGQDVFYLGRISNRPGVRTQVRGAEETDWWTSTRSVRPSSRVSNIGAQKHC